MLNFDSCCFEVNADLMKPDIRKYVKHTIQDIEGTEQTYFEAKNIQAGLSHIKYFPNTGIVVSNISGKLLPIEHRQLINQNNIDQAFDLIHASGFLRPEDYMSIYDTGIVRTIDITENIQVPNVTEYLQAVSCITSQNYKNEFYTGRGEHVGKTGRVFKGKQKTFKERLLLYDKQHETGNKEYTGTLRIESNRNTFESIRKDINGNNTLLDILTTIERPVLNLLTKILGYNEANKNLYDMAYRTPDIKQFLFESALQQAGNDMEIVKEVLKIANKGNSRSTLNRYIKQIEYYKRNKETGTAGANYIQDILQKLSA